MHSAVVHETYSDWNGIIATSAGALYNLQSTDSPVKAGRHLVSSKQPHIILSSPMSSEIVVEVANFPASDAYKADPSVFNPALELLAASKGALK